ncbi:integrator complex subunit 15-like [Lineus longissimus]|uniref:integrator complex subunit 15-like n=1 Tax=Lineus longissimus TaxID=88925 RepID=UPI002B4EBBCC
MASEFLRGSKFPDSVRIALKDIERCVPRDEGSAIPGLNHAEGNAERIADEYIFMYRVGRPLQRFSAIQELQLQEIMIDFFGNDNYAGKIKTQAFLLLFSCKGSATHYKVELLCKLVSMAIALKTKPILDYAGAWMREQHYSSPGCMKLAQHVIHDYCLLVPGATSSLQELPKISTPFTCNIITAFTHVYRLQGLKPPASLPNGLLEVITEWVSIDNSLLLYSALNAYGSNIETPLPGLISWCIYAPIQLLQKQPKIEVEELRRINQLYSKLFLGLLNSLLSTKTLFNPPKELLPRAIVKDIVDTIVTSAKLLPDAGEHDCLQVVLERLGQVLQVAMVTKTIFTDKATLKQICSSLPQNRLLQIVLN